MANNVLDHTKSTGVINFLKRYYEWDAEHLQQVKSVHDIDYIERLKFAQLTGWSAAGWPMKKKGVVVYRTPLPRRLFYFLMMATIIILTALYLQINADVLDVVSKGHGWMNVFFSCVSMCVFSLPLTKKYWALLEHFLEKMHMHYHRERFEFSQKVYLKIHRFCIVDTVYFIAMTKGAILCYYGIPVYANFANGAFTNSSADVDYEYAVYYALPFDYKRSFPVYLTVQILGITSSYCCANSFTNIIILLNLVVFHIWGHLTVLKDVIDTFMMGIRNTDQNNDHFDVEESVRVNRKLRDIVDYHREIMSFIGQTSEAFSAIIFALYAFFQVSICLMMLECTQTDLKGAAQFGIIFGASVQLLMLLCLVVELIGSKSEELIDAVYGLPWECMDNNTRKIVHILLLNVQKPVRLKALGLAEVGVKTGATIIKTSLSYFMFLNSSQS